MTIKQKRQDGYNLVWNDNTCELHRIDSACGTGGIGPRDHIPEHLHFLQGRYAGGRLQVSRWDPDTKTTGEVQFVNCYRCTPDQPRPG